MKLFRMFVMFKRQRYVPTKADRQNQSCCLRKRYSRNMNTDGPELVVKKSTQMIEADMDASLVIPIVFVFVPPKHPRRNTVIHI